MISANVINYTITDKSGKEVGSYSQHAYCSPRHYRECSKYTPVEDFKIQPYGLDEEEEEWYGEICNLGDFIRMLKEAKLFN